MAKSAIYNDMFSNNIISTKEFIVSGEKPYNMYFNKILSFPSLFDNISLVTEHIIKTSNLEFDKICATSSSSIPYATNAATSLEKGILYINDEGNDKSEKYNIKGITIEGGMNIDDKILLIETIVSTDFYINNIIHKIKKYGGNVMGIIVILNQYEGEFINLLSQDEKIINVLNIYDIFNHLENNNKIDLFYCERVKFYCEKITKTNIQKLIEKQNSNDSNENSNTNDSNTIQEVEVKQPFVGQ